MSVSSAEDTGSEAMTLQEHAENIRAAIRAARKDGYRLSLEEGGVYEEAYVDLEEYVTKGKGREVLHDWDAVIVSFD